VVLRTSLEDPLWLVLADRRSLKQILLNLLSNALKFTEAGGQVIVSSLHGEAGSVVLRVRDTGIGMSQDDIVQAMKPFQQLETAPRQAVGTGLGLSLTKALVEANRASIHLESAPGAGTCVDLVFPLPRVLKD
jgi:signal transduction histidine kinase